MASETQHSSDLQTSSHSQYNIVSNNNVYTEQPQEVQTRSSKVTSRPERYGNNSYD